ncbi:choice-of-anchor F family protein [Thiohalobacter thiocyanaticus]|uniref:Choice-of-anchor F family protein n=1 Tax=Thiohalobacter thiocyanaticus TaxID=585455 RepID=A0A426QIQ9_9GAMM|nr:choice-of-anchor F family protein [Thiohalobacter thiocyanaticus]RRQ21587.1 choice-of-anchor F family protein [Thiohalobacter thiocyanaticus]
MINSTRKDAPSAAGCSLLARTALAIAMAGLVLPTQAGKITSTPSASGAPGFGGWNLSNVEVVLDGTQGAIGSNESWFDPATGAYNFAPDSDFSYESLVFDDAGTLMGIVLAKDWPIGEPAGIKIVNNDPGVKNDKPANCIMSTSYLEGNYLDSIDPKQVTCSSAFQTHKRYKVAMLPNTVDGIGSESVDLVFNVEAETGTRDYQVFQKINNWTDGRLQGFKLEVGFGVGASFVSATDAGVDLANLNIAVPSDLWSPTQLATFSAGLFGPEDKHTGELGFFDPESRAGFLIDEYVAGIQPLTDTLTATTPLASNYHDVPAGAGVAANQFGPWLPNNMLPYGIFFDDDGNPETDAELLAWYGYNPAIGGLGWMRGAEDSFAAISADEIQAMGANLSYTSDLIDDLVNIGLNYVVRVGDVSTFPASANNSFTIRVTPTPDTSGSGVPAYVGQTPDPLLLYTDSNASVLLQPEPTFEIGSLLTARVGDADLNQDPMVTEEVTVAISSNSGLSDALTLVEQGANRGVFAATLPDSYSNVTPGTVITLAYTDVSEAMEKTSTTTAVDVSTPVLSDVSITDLSVPTWVFDGSPNMLSVTIQNDKLAAGFASGTVLLTGSDGSEFTASFSDLGVGKKLRFRFKWTAELADPTVPESVEWVASVTVADTIVDGAEALTEVKVKPGKRANK